MNKRAFNLPKNHQGFALITVLVISFLGSLIVFDTIQENLNQERMAGNYSKELNARLQAENGLAEAYNMLSADSTLSTDDMMTQLNSAQNDAGGYHHNIDAWLDSDIREVNSSGFHYDGTYAMRGSFSLASSSGNTVFTGAITTCDGATLGGSGTIDSYDSSEGAYDSSNPGNNGDVSVLNEDASGLDLSGSSPIDGNVSINGDLTMSGSASISGDAHVSGNIDLGSSGSIDGNAQATGNVTNSYSSTTMDSISANGDVTILNSYDNPISYSGELNYPSYGSVSNATYYDTDQVSAVGTEPCDVLDLASEFANTTDGVGSLSSTTPTDYSFSYWPYTDYVFTDAGLESYNKSTGTTDSFDTETATIDFLGEDTEVYVMSIDNFQNGNTITIESGNNVTIYLSGNTSIEDKIYVEDGATLTIITEDTFTTTADGGVYALDSDGNTATSAVNSDGDNSFILYSGYDSEGDNSDYGITLSGSTDMFLTAYAPNAAMNVTASGDIYGSLRTDYLNVTGGAGVHFDEQITNTTIGDSDSSSSTPTITRWF
ncbi:hypothetical protein DS885_12250 [Psychromonas sp. B3M02]|uniref:pilus assembly PilX N-terminal domain-containing protein n=1 Tax=Psychromonas sp. B3M02 TaxID=2267226 RepID=UPI000DE9C17A|nr:pilus assembly PilX N-terminal domain-containing protein [Psychromonas sp. B3M02]RBW44078.1 hypothetical protein DS885_12250 [Psychromonas sp. B3M02]